MTERELAGYRQELLRMATRIEGDMSELTDEALRKAGGEASGSLSNTPLHLADLGTDTFEHEVTIGLLETEGQTLQEIAAAVGRIDNGTYGHCELCGVEIGRERLQALPFVRHCIECARRVQQDEVSPALTWTPDGPVQPDRSSCSVRSAHASSIDSPSPLALSSISPHTCGTLRGANRFPSRARVSAVLSMATGGLTN